MLQSQTASSIRTWAEWGQSTINGLWGDALHASGNGLSIPMQFYNEGRPLSIEGTGTAFGPPSSGRICILVHGLFCNERAWSFDTQNSTESRTTYGHLLQQDLSFNPYFVRYNTGLSIADNGRELSILIEKLIRACPAPVEDILLIGHSMGGLVLRHACTYATRAQSRWVRHVSRIIYLGTPHDGADLAKLLAVASSTLATIPHPVTRLISTILNLRSQGLHDLRHGFTMHAHAPADVDAAIRADGSGVDCLPWLESAQHCFISGTVAESPSHFVSRLLGDGLVRPARGARIAPSHAADSPSRSGHAYAVLPGVHHMALTREPRVYTQILDWCKG